MLRCQPSKWLWGLLPLAGLAAAAWFVGAESLENKLQAAADAQLRSSGATWAAVEMDGRDAKLTGQAPSEEAIEDAARLVAGTYGVRLVDSSGAELAPIVELDPPVVERVAGNSQKPTITGTWPEGVAKTLAVTLAGKTYVLGQDAALTSDGAGKWTLKVPEDLAEGVHDVNVRITDGARSQAVDDSTDEVVVDLTPPDPPEIVSVEDVDGAKVIAGTFDSSSAAMTVTAAGTAYEMGRTDAVQVEGGSWRLVLPGSVEPGAHDVAVETRDEHGNASSASRERFLTIEPPPPEAPAAPSVNPVEGFGNAPTITGTWSEGDGNSLSVTLAGKEYVLGRDGELSSDGSGNWTLQPSEVLADGNYSVVATVTNETGQSTPSPSGASITVDTSPPPTPVVNATQGAAVRPSITGTWAEGDAIKLTVELDGTVYEVSQSGALTSDGSGNWTLRPERDLDDGTYDVVVTTTDAAGNTSTDRGYGEVVVDSSAPAVPTVNTLLTRLRQPVVTGAWPSSDAKSLSISIAGLTFNSGESPELTIDGDNWTLKMPTNLEDGTYNVVATAFDSVGNKATDASEGELVVDATPPAVPTVNTYRSVFPRPLISGTYAADEVETMAVTVAGNTYAMGSAGELSTDNKGNWSVLVNEDLAPGTYEVEVIVADAAGNQRTDTTSGEVVIEPSGDEPQQAAAPVTESGQAARCQVLFDELLSGRGIQFEPGRDDIRAASGELLDRLADVIRQCPDARIEIGGHTDWQGSANYNQALSERRANAVRDALVARGAKAGNITAVGYGETRPIADNASEEGRARNRRTEFKVQP